MCGIIGIASMRPIGDRSWLAAGREALYHRGPDDCGEKWSDDGRVGLGFRRLAIIDLSPLGNQPMENIAGDLCIVFNGEIYNFTELKRELSARGHSFRSHSDTEVILAAYREWGTECLSRLNGMFAFAIHDRRGGRLFLARDRAGEKPLFYAIANGALRFASELKGILADRSVPRRIDREALDSYLAMGFAPGDRCILSGAHKMPPAHALTYDLATGEARTWRYWSIPEYGPPADAGVGGEADLLNEIESLLEDAVSRQLVADVPVGILLSGGVDSSLVTAMAVRSAPHVKTFTIRFPGYGEYDETEHARLIARHFGTEQVELDAGETTVDLLPLLARQFDEPIVDSSMIPTYLVSRMVREHCTVALGGDGGDELFGGYGHHSRLLWISEKLGRVPRALRAPLSYAAGAFLPAGAKGRNWIQALGGDLKSGVPLIASYFDRPLRQMLMRGESGWPFVAEKIRDDRLPKSADLLERATRMDFSNYLAEDILVKVDRASMLASLEVRAPLLDYRVIEFAFSRVPSHLKATPTGRKILLKKLAERLLPPEFDRQRKQGFSIPLARWLQSGAWREFFSSILLDQQSTIFDHGVVRDLLAGQVKGRANSERLFALALFELWRREYGMSL